MHVSRLRAPTESGTVLSVPELKDIPRIIGENFQLLQSWDYNFQGRSAQELRNLVRRESASVHAFAKSHSPPNTDCPIVLSGHQPEFFHPGVWIKNFACSAIARRCDGTSMHLTVDSDKAKLASIRVPSGSIDSPRLVSVHLDQGQSELPLEEYNVRDEQTFRGVGDRVANLVAPFGFSPLASTIWQRADIVARETTNLGLRTTMLRAGIEAEWRSSNHEILASQLCSQTGFLWFFCHLAANINRFAQSYNDALKRYRTRAKIRSKNHPVPELRQLDGWIESPFWTWMPGEGRRQPMWIRSGATDIQLSDGRSWELALPLGRQRDACCAVERLIDELDSGRKIRTRALTTTMFTRLCLADLFVHGIGGAKYDELCDEIISSFFGIRPPTYLALTGTLHLPLVAQRPEVRSEFHKLKKRLRDLIHNPQRHIDLQNPPNNHFSDLVQERWNLSRSIPVYRKERRARFFRIRSLNAHLTPAVQSQIDETIERLDELHDARRSDHIYRNREWPFCVFPGAVLQDFYLPFLNDSW